MTPKAAVARWTSGEKWGVSEGSMLPLERNIAGRGQALTAAFHPRCLADTGGRATKTAGSPIEPLVKPYWNRFRVFEASSTKYRPVFGMFTKPNRAPAPGGVPVLSRSFT